MNEIINPRKLIITKKSCKNVKDRIFLSKTREFLKFLIEKRTTIKDKQSPKTKDPIKLAKTISPLMLL